MKQEDIIKFKKRNIPWNKGLKTGIVPKTAFKKGCVSWCKGTKGIMKVNNGSFKKGEHRSVKTEFKKGCKFSKGFKEKMSNAKKNIIPKNINSIKGWNKGQSMENLKGKNHWNWKGGITPINQQIRVSLEFKLWRKSVFERDNFTCQKTGIQGGKLVAHHINNFADFPELRTSIENGITLSEKIHREFHKKYGRKNNTREQLNKFIK